LCLIYKIIQISELWIKSFIQIIINWKFSKFKRELKIFSKNYYLLWFDSVKKNSNYILRRKVFCFWIMYRIFCLIFSIIKVLILIYFLNRFFFLITIFLSPTFYSWMRYLLQISTFFVLYVKFISKDNVLISLSRIEVRVTPQTDY
jgi:hypothetical protein